MDPITRNIARVLTAAAERGRRISYRELASEINHWHPTGRGMGVYLQELLAFTAQHGLPCLTSILVKAGHDRPPEDALKFIVEKYGNLDILAEQRRVNEFNWSGIREFGFRAVPEIGIDYSRLFATRVYGFEPASWGMLGFSHERTREKTLQIMNGKPIYVVQFCSPHSREIEGTDVVTISDADKGRVLGVAEVQPRPANPDTHITAEAREIMIRTWGRYRWEFGLEITRAWVFPSKPWTKEALPNARSLSWEVTRGIERLTDEEASLIKQYSLSEVDVLNQPPVAVQFSPRDPKDTTYLAICSTDEVLKKLASPPGMKLVKIGLSGDTERRLGELNGHHYARMLGLKFTMYATNRWRTQSEAMGKESDALEWALENTKHASGEFFFMTDDQVAKALLLVKPPKRVA